MHKRRAQDGVDIIVAALSSPEGDTASFEDVVLLDSL